MKSASSPTLQLESVSTKWNKDGEECLRNISLTVVSGKCVSLLGPVGAGKVDNIKLLDQIY